MREPLSNASQPASCSTQRYDFEVLAVIVNYNSKHFLAIEKKLLEGLAELGRRVRLKLLLVDNCSTDGSFEELKEHAERVGVDAEAIRLSKNYGFTRAVNIAWHYARRRWKFKYLMLLNNDLVIVPSNVAKLLKYLEIDDIAGVQGTIMQATNPRLIDNCGHYIDIFGLTYPICRGYMLSCSKICCPSFLSGALSIYKSKVIYEIDQPFDNEVECYYDDKYLGLILWSKNYKLVHIPLIAAYHLGSASYVGYSVLKFRNTKWFEGIVISEISLSKFSSRKSLQYQVILIFTIIAILLSILFLRNYFKSLLLAIKVADRIKENTKDKILIDSIPKLNAKLNIFIRRLHRGVQIER